MAWRGVQQAMIARYTFPAIIPAVPHIGRSTHGTHLRPSTGTSASCPVASPDRMMMGYTSSHIGVLATPLSTHERRTFIYAADSPPRTFTFRRYSSVRSWFASWFASASGRSAPGALYHGDWFDCHFMHRHKAACSLCYCPAGTGGSLSTYPTNVALSEVYPHTLLRGHVRSLVLLRLPMMHPRACASARPIPVRTGWCFFRASELCAVAVESRMSNAQSSAPSPLAPPLASGFRRQALWPAPRSEERGKLRPGSTAHELESAPPALRRRCAAAAARLHRVKRSVQLQQDLSSLLVRRTAVWIALHGFIKANQCCVPSRSLRK